MKRGFSRSDFVLKYHQNPQVLKRRSIEKKKKKERKRKKETRVSTNKRGSQYFERRKILQLEISFLM
jgi:hypothetical protein